MMAVWKCHGGGGAATRRLILLRLLLLVVYWLGFAAILPCCAQEAAATAADAATETSATAEDIVDEYIDLDQDKSESTTDGFLTEEELPAVQETDSTSTPQSTENQTTTTEAQGNGDEVTTTSESLTASESMEGEQTQQQQQQQQESSSGEKVVQSGPFIDLLGPTLLSLVLTGENTARFEQNHTNDALRGKKVVGLYFSADWCGPCRQFTPELVRFYEKINTKRGKQDQFQIVWISRCRDVNAYTQYFAQMPWIALPPDEALGARGQMLGEKFGVKGIPSLVLLDDLGSVITTDARNMVPKDKMGIGFPWRNPIATLYMTIVPRSLRFMIRSHVDMAKTQVLQRIKSIVAPRRRKA